MEELTPTTSTEPAAAGEAPVNSRRRARVMIGLLVLLVLLAVNLAIGSGKLQMEKVISESMEPTLLVGDVLLADGNIYPDRYDIVCTWDPLEPKDKLVKRVMGLPGDEIRVTDGVLYVNGKEEFNAFATENQLHFKDTVIVVPEDNLFLMGDNRNNSFDSLNFGPVAVESVRGVVQAVLWPPKRWRGPATLYGDLRVKTPE